MNARRRQEVGATARQWAMSTFSWDVIGGRLESEYAVALHQARVAA
jgi:hypothetical protein